MRLVVRIGRGNQYAMLAQGVLGEMSRAAPGRAGKKPPKAGGKEGSIDRGRKNREP